MQDIIIEEKAPELANVLTITSDKLTFFYEMSEDEKVSWLADIIERAKIFIDMDKYAFSWLIYKHDPNSFLGTYYNSFVLAHKIYSNAKPVIECIGWDKRHGKVYNIYEREDGKIFKSFYSDGHPDHELKREWSFRVPHNSDDFHKFTEQMFVPDKADTTPVGEFISEITVK